MIARATTLSKNTLSNMQTLPRFKLFLVAFFAQIIAIQPGLEIWTVENDLGSNLGWRSVCQDGNLILGCNTGVPWMLAIPFGISGLIMVLYLFKDSIPNERIRSTISNYYWVAYLLNAVLLYVVWFSTINYKDTLNSNQQAYYKIGLSTWLVFLAMVILIFLAFADLKFAKNVTQPQRFVLYAISLTLLSMQLTVRNDPGVFDIGWKNASNLDLFNFGNMITPILADYPLTFWIAVILQFALLFMIVFRKIDTENAMIPGVISILAGLSLFSIWAQVSNHIRILNDNSGATEDVYDQGMAMWFIFPASIFLITAGLLMLQTVKKQYEENVKKRYYSAFPYGRQSPVWSLVTFIVALGLILLSTFNQPAADDEALRFVVVQIITFICIFSIASISLNIHTGLTGMVNFGVIFFVAIGAITTALLPGKYGVNPLLAMFIGIILSSIIGFLLAFPTIRLRDDYFAIVTISLGEIVRFMLRVEPWLRYDPTLVDVDRPGISNYERPFESWWGEQSFTYPEIGGLFGGTDVPYLHLLMVVAILGLIVSYVIAEYLFNSPYGRIMKTIREDEDVVESYGHDVFRFKAIVLGVGAGMAAFAGSLFAWVQDNVFPDFLNPVGTTFLFWTAFILGGKGNNKGMIVGSGFVILIDLTLRTLSSSNRVANANTFLDNLDKLFQFVVVDIGGRIFSEASYQDIFPTAADATVNVNFLRIALMGLSIILLMVWNEKGILPEIPYRPSKPKTISNKLINSDLAEVKFAPPSKEDRKETES